MPPSRSSAMRGRVREVRPQAYLPAVLWWETCSAAPLRRAISTASSSASSTRDISSRRCVTYGLPWRAATAASATTSSVPAYVPGV